MYDYLIVGAGMTNSPPVYHFHVTRLYTNPCFQGPSGLCAAKTILQCEPFAKIKILDSVSSHKNITVNLGSLLIIRAL